MSTGTQSTMLFLEFLHRYIVYRIWSVFLTPKPVFPLIYLFTYLFVHSFILHPDSSSQPPYLLSSQSHPSPSISHFSPLFFPFPLTFILEQGFSHQPTEAQEVTSTLNISFPTEAQLEVQLKKRIDPSQLLLKKKEKNILLNLWKEPRQAIISEFWFVPRSSCFQEQLF